MKISFASTPSNKPLGPDVNLKTIAQSTAGFSGADLENLVNEAALLAARKGKKAITEPEIEEASIKVVAGPEKKSRVVTDKEKRLTAYHEAGHAITGYYCPTQRSRASVSASFPAARQAAIPCICPTRNRVMSPALP